MPITRKYHCNFDYFEDGAFDGDGCIHISKNGQASVHLCGNKKFIEEVQNKLINYLGLNKTKIYKLTDKCHQFTYGGNKQVKKILNWLYKDANIYLDRKYKKYKEITNGLAVSS